MGLIKGVENAFKFLYEKKLIITSQHMWSQIAEKVFELSEKVTGGDEKSLLAHSDHEKNRYGDIVPFKDNRVKVSTSQMNTDGYINASYVTLQREECRYIMAAAPPESQIREFWKMVVEQQVPGIVMLTKEREGGRKKADIYFPEKAGEWKTYGQLTVICMKLTEGNGYTSRQLVVKNESRVIHKLSHFQYLNWDGRPAPRDIQNFLEFHEKVSESRILEKKRTVGRSLVSKVTGGRFDSSPFKAPIVQCSSGSSRSGTFILIDALIQCLQSNRPSTFCIEKLIMKLRTQRIKSVLKVEQITFIYNCLIAYCQSRDSKLIKLEPLLKQHSFKTPFSLDIMTFIFPEEWIVKPAELNKYLKKQRAPKRGIQNDTLQPSPSKKERVQGRDSQPNKEEKTEVRRKYRLETQEQMRNQEKSHPKTHFVTNPFYIGPESDGAFPSTTVSHR